jgi:hypothetical protein
MTLIQITTRSGVPNSHLTADPPLVASALGEGGSGTKQKGRKNHFVTYLKHLGTLSVALGCVIAVNADPLSGSALPTSEVSAAAGRSLAATAPHSSLDRLLAKAESPDALPGDFANNLPWYYRAWPESTFRNLIIYSAQLNRTAAPQGPIDSLAGLLEEVINEA